MFIKNRMGGGGGMGKPAADKVITKQTSPSNDSDNERYIDTPEEQHRFADTLKKKLKAGRPPIDKAGNM